MIGGVFQKLLSSLKPDLTDLRRGSDELLNFFFRYSGFTVLILFETEDA